MLPQVAIVGRPNVGKSSLMNMLAGRRVSIVDPTAGVTRDRISFELELPPADAKGPPRHCELIDTGGYGIYSGEEHLAPLTERVEQQIDFAVREAALILFVIDAQAGLTPLDEQVARLLRERIGDTGRVILLANKVDHEKYEAHAMEATRLGFGDPLTLSATTGHGKAVLLETLATRLDFDAQQPPAPSEMLLAIVGKRNAGKSTLVNTLAGAPRVIASEIAGTTRDSVDVRFELDGRAFTAIDTAGARKRKSLAGDVEFYALHRLLRSIRRADVVMLLLDATLPVSGVEKRLAQEITEHHKPCVITVNKWDLVRDKLALEDYLKYLGQMLRGLDYAPIAAVSAKDGDGVREAVLTAVELHEQAGRRVSTGELNRVVKDILSQRGPSSKLGRQAKVYYATMPTVRPPTIALFVNHPELFDDRYRRYMVNAFRDRLPYEEVPIKLLIRPRRREHLGAAPVAEA